MKNRGKLLLTLFLITWVLFAFISLVNNGHKYIGKSFFKSDSFQITLENYKEQLGRYVLAPFDAEEAKKNITVSQDEIESHRNFYGTLSEQIESIQAQYQERIWQIEGENEVEETVAVEQTPDEEPKEATETNSKAEESSNADLIEILKKERDAKIADIKENFNNDEHVEKKIRKQKEEIIDLYAEQEERNRKDFLNEYGYFAYNFHHVGKGEVFESGDLNSTNIFTESFGNQQPYLRVDSTVRIFPYELKNEFHDDLVFDDVYVEGAVSQFEGDISIPKSMMNATGFKNDYANFTISKIIFYVIWGTGILALIGLLTFAKPSLLISMESNKVKELFMRLPIDVRAVIVIILLLTGFTLMEGFVNNSIQHIMYYYEWNTIITDLFNILIPVVIMFSTTSAAIVGAVWVWQSINTEAKFKSEINKAFLYRLADGMQDLFINRTIGTQSIAILVVAFLAGIGFVGALMEPGLTVIYIILLFFIGLPASIIFLRRMGYLNRILKQTKDMAEGRLTTEIKVKGKSPLAKHAAHLNELREGVRKSMSEQAKSERLKTELITNVSHDLRTPLTSIITYTDLLKNPDITEEERKHYIDVLDKKSARLKTLIEDLFEVSKMASGNMELTKRRVDLSQLLQQAIGEHEEAFEKANLELRVSLPEKPLFAYVDGQKWWRVIDNLVMNALKYSLEGSRVYLTLKQNQSQAEFTVKNISSYEMSENVEELTERFKRADASRHTDGSGLGLAIAQSIVDMHNGRLMIDVDGDLFKVTVLVPAEI